MSIYYVIEEAQKTGPFDLMTMMKKIRSGRLNPKSLVYVDQAETPVEAITVHELNELFKGDAAPAYTPAAELNTTKQIIDLTAALKDAWSFFVRNQSLTLVGGVGALILIVATYILAIILPAAIIAIFCSIVGGFAYFAYLSFILRTVRGERVSLKPFLAELKQIYGKPLLLAGAVATGLTLGVPALIGALVSGIGYLFIIPGFIGFALFTMAPFIITDNPQISYMDALKQSSGWVRAQGVDNLGAIVALVFFNVIGLIAFFFPVFITLPVSAIALADIYERRNSNA